MGGMDRDGHTPATGDETQHAQGDDALGEPGKKALQEERKARQAAERTAREAQERVSALEAADMRREVAADKGLTDAQAAYLTGDSREDMETAADGMLAAFAPPQSRDNGRALPREKLRPGAISPDDNDDQDAARVADRILDRGF